MELQSKYLVYFPLLAGLMGCILLLSSCGRIAMLPVGHSFIWPISKGYPFNLSMQWFTLSKRVPGPGGICLERSQHPLYQHCPVFGSYGPNTVNQRFYHSLTQDLPGFCRRCSHFGGINIKIREKVQVSFSHCYHACTVFPYASA